MVGELLDDHQSIGDVDLFADFPAAPSQRGRPRGWKEGVEHVALEDLLLQSMPDRHQVTRDSGTGASRVEPTGTADETIPWRQSPAVRHRARRRSAPSH